MMSDEPTDDDHDTYEDYMNRKDDYEMSDDKKKIFEWADNPEEAERLHGSEREECINRLGPIDGRWHGALEELSRACWESGWDSAVGKLKYRAESAEAEVERLTKVRNELNRKLGLAYCDIIESRSDKKGD